VKYLVFMADYPSNNFLEDYSSDNSRPWWLYCFDKIQWSWLKVADAIILESDLARREIFLPRVGDRVFTVAAPLNESVVQQYKEIERPVCVDTRFQFTVVYTGSFYPIYSFDSLIETIRLAETKYPDKYRWRFAGWAGNPLDELATRPNSCVELLGALDALELIKLQKSADVLISLRKNSTPNEKQWNRYAYSAKVYDYLLAARPVLTTDVPVIELGMRPFLNFIDSEDPEDILAAIEQICEHPPSQKLLERGRDYVIEHHSTSAVARELKPILEQISVKYS
jgi:hypothetical protein